LARGTPTFLIYSGVLFVLPCGLPSVNKGDAKCKCAMQNENFISEPIGPARGKTDSPQKASPWAYREGLKLGAFVAVWLHNPLIGFLYHEN